MKVIRFSDLVAAGQEAGKRVFIRADLNVPQDDAGNITEDTRVRASVPAIRAALDAGAAVMVTSHLGRPTEGEFKPEDSLAPVAQRLSELLGQPVELKQNWVDGVDVAPGQVVLLENCRVNKGEKKNSDELAQKMAKLCDIYVNDAFGTAHRAEATTHGIAKFAPVVAAGPLLAAELDALGKALGAPQRPLLAIVAGSKVSTKLSILQSLADKVDNLIVGGGIANTFMKAVGLNIGKSLAEADLVGEAKTIIDKMAARGATVPMAIRPPPTWSACARRPKVQRRSAISSKAKSPSRMPRSTISCCCGATARRLTCLPWWSTTTTWASPTSSAATTISTTLSANCRLSARWAGPSRPMPMSR